MKVIDVTSNQNINKFNKAISMPNKKSIVYFHSPNCGHCKDFNPVWDETMAGMPDMKNSMVARVSADAMGLVNCDTNIDGFPTVLSMIGGKRKKEFRDAMAKVGGKGMADDIIEKSLSDKQFGSVVPESVTEQDFLEIEQMIKNMQTKDGRKMNASGGIASMLGE